MILENHMDAKTEKELIRYHLKQQNILDIISDDILNALQIYSFKPNEFIVRSNHPADFLYFYINGRSKVTYTLENGKSLLLRFYNSFEVIGDVELFEYDRYISDMLAITHVTCIGVKTDFLLKRIHHHPELLMYFCRTLAHKLASFNKASAINLLYPLENRLAGYLIAVSDQNTESANIIEEIQTGNLTELADLLGSSYRQLTRVIKKLKTDHIIRKDEHRIEIIDRERLVILAKELYA